MKNTTKLCRDTRFLTVSRVGFMNADLQMSYRVEKDGVTVGFVRKVNHGRNRWFAYDADGSYVCNGPSRKDAVRVF